MENIGVKCWNNKVKSLEHDEPTRVASYREEHQDRDNVHPLSIWSYKTNQAGEQRRILIAKAPLNLGITKV